MAALGLGCNYGLPLVVASGGYSVVAECRLLIVVEHGLWPQASVVVALGLWSTGSVVVVLNCSAACGIFPDQGLNPCPLHCKADS